MRYRFGEFEVDAARLRLLRAGQPVAVEPRVLELLVYLLERRDRLVTKDELVAALWEGRAVTDAALSRCLYQARKALGSSSESQRYLRTVHGRGLRFDDTVEVEEVADERKNGAGGPPPDPPAAGEPVPAVAEPAAAPPIALPPAAPSAAPRRPRHLGGLIAIATVLVLLTAGAFLLASRDRVPAPRIAAAPAPPPEARPTLALLPLTVAPDAGVDEALGRELSLLALSLTDLLHTRLSGIPEMQVRPLLTALEQATAADSLREAALEVGATHVITGMVRPEGDGARAVAELIAYEIPPRLPARPTPLGRFALPLLRDAADFGALIEVRDAMAQRAVRLVGSPFVLTDPEPGGTREPEAWRLYVVAYQRLSDDFCAGSGPAIALLERALELDPDFGLAWEAVGTAHYNRVWACGESAEVHAAAFAALDRAEAVAPALRNPRMLRITLLIETGRVEEAYERILRELDAYPDDPLSLNARSYALRYAGFLEPAAAALDRTLELDPLAFAVGALGGSPNAYLHQGRLERFLEAVPVSEMAYHRWYRGFAELLLGHPERARESLEPAFRSSPGEVFGRLSHALLAVIDGDPEAARAIVRQVSSQRDELGAVDPEITLKQAQILALAGDREGALAELGKTVEQGFFCVRCFALDPSLAGLRDTAEWGRVVGEARRRHVAFADRFGLVPETG
jgi:DNA-binding winged helix-turn-helix (wHTH) protein/tetratricopeptide (TPR) repeat protein/TolB-like protein